MKEELGELLKTMGLTLSEEKTKVTHITEGFHFLGYRVIRKRGKNGNTVAKVEIPKAAVKKFQAKIRRILAPNTVNESLYAKIEALNRLIRGWCEYYRCCNNSGFTNLNSFVRSDMGCWVYEQNNPLPHRPDR